MHALSLSLTHTLMHAHMQRMRRAHSLTDTQIQIDCSTTPSGCCVAWPTKTFAAGTRLPSCPTRRNVGAAGAARRWAPVMTHMPACYTVAHAQCVPRAYDFSTYFSFLFASLTLASSSCNYFAYEFYPRSWTVPHHLFDFAVGDSAVHLWCCPHPQL